MDGRVGDKAEQIAAPQARSEKRLGQHIMKQSNRQTTGQQVAELKKYPHWPSIHFFFLRAHVPGLSLDVAYAFFFALKAPPGGEETDRKAAWG